MARPGITSNPKFLRLCHLLQMPRPHVLGHLEFLWRGPYESGNPMIGDAVDVELAAEWSGERGILFRALMSAGGQDRAGFIEPVDGKTDCYQIHDLWDHAPDYVRKRREREREREAKGKTLSDLRRDAARKRWDASDHVNANGMQADATDRHLHANGCKRDANERTRAPAPAPAPNKDKPAAQATSEAASRPSSADASVLVFPCIKGRKSQFTEWPLSGELISEWGMTYPAVDVMQECRRALEWVKANPAKRKTFAGMRAFLSSWLSRQQDRGAAPARRMAYANGHANGVPDKLGTAAHAALDSISLDRGLR